MRVWELTCQAFVQLNKSPPNQPSSKSDSGRTALPYSSSTGIRHDRKEFLRRILEKIENGFIHAVKGSLAALLMCLRIPNYFSPQNN
jgi:hypothetical protein